MRRQKYNYATGQVEVLDITDHRYVCSIRKPLEATLLMTNNATGEVIERTVQLTADEQVTYEGLKTDQERDQPDPGASSSSSKDPHHPLR
jgi:hypothetical protein